MQRGECGAGARDCRRIRVEALGRHGSCVLDRNRQHQAVVGRGDHLRAHARPRRGARRDRLDPPVDIGLRAVARNAQDMPAARAAHHEDAVGQAPQALDLHAFRLGLRIEAQALQAAPCVIEIRVHPADPFFQSFGS